MAYASLSFVAVAVVLASTLTAAFGNGGFSIRAAEGSCTPDKERCAGAKGYPYVHYAHCCEEGSVCMEDAHLGWGSWCVKPKKESYGKCYLNGDRCMGAPGKPYVPFHPCCGDGECVKDEKLDWGFFCKDGTYGDDYDVEEHTKDYKVVYFKPEKKGEYGKAYKEEYEKDYEEYVKKYEDPYYNSYGKKYWEEEYKAYEDTYKGSDYGYGHGYGHGGGYGYGKDKKGADPKKSEKPKKPKFGDDVPSMGGDGFGGGGFPPTDGEDENPPTDGEDENPPTDGEDENPPAEQPEVRSVPGAPGLTLSCPAGGQGGQTAAAVVVPNPAVGDDESSADVSFTLPADALCPGDTAATISAENAQAAVNNFCAPLIADFGASNVACFLSGVESGGSARQLVIEDQSRLPALSARQGTESATIIIIVVFNTEVPGIAVAVQAQINSSPLATGTVPDVPAESEAP